MIPALFLAAVLGTNAPQSGAQTVPGAVIAASVAQAVQTRLRQAGSTATFTVVDQRDQILPAGNVEVRVDSIAGPFPRARLGVPVWLRVDARPVRPITVWIAMHDERDVPVYAQAYAAETPGAELQVRTRRVDMTCCPGSLFVPDARIDGLRLHRSVQEDMPVLAGDFEPLPAVRANERVTVGVSRGVVHLAAAGTALADGRIGEMVTIRVDQGRLPLRARVVGPQQVRIDE